MNYYDILEVSHTASPEVIQNAYKTLAKKYHPDVFQGDKFFAEEQMKQINEAYEVLSDPQKRMEYDRRIKDDLNSNSDNEETAKHNSSNAADAKASEPPKVKQKRKKPFWALSWVFICFLMFLSIMFEWKWMFWVSLVLGCGRFIINKKEPAYKTRGLVRIISIGAVGFMIFSCYVMHYDDTPVAQTSENSTSVSQHETSDTQNKNNNFDSLNNTEVSEITDSSENKEVPVVTDSPDMTVSSRNLLGTFTQVGLYDHEAYADLNSEYVPKIYLYDDNTFEFYCNFYEGMKVYEGSWQVSADMGGAEYHFMVENEPLLPNLDFYINYNKSRCDADFLTDYTLDAPFGMTSIETVLFHVDIAGMEEKTTDNPINKDILHEEIQLLNKPSKKYNITHGTSFSDGIAFIKYYEEDDYITAYENNSFIYAAIDTSGNELFRLEDFQDTGIWPVYKGGIYLIDNSVYNNKGKLIASPEISGYDEIYEGANHNGYVIVTKYIESYRGASFTVGVINNKGEWEIPLCEEGQWNSDEYIYTWDKSSYYIYEEECQNNTVGNLDRDIVSVDNNGNIDIILKNYNGLLCVLSNSKGNESKIFGDEFLVAAEYYYDSDFYDWRTGDYHVYDFEGNIILDLSEYNIHDELDVEYYNGYFLFTVMNNKGTQYLCLVDSSGKIVVEPFEVYRPKVYTTYYPLNETGFVFYDAANKSYLHIGYDGNIVKYEDISKFNSFSDGLALVYNDQTYRYYYINYKGEIIIE